MSVSLRLVLGAIVLVPNVFVKALLAPVLGLQIARLFVLGHDACHQSLFENRLANRWIGRPSFCRR
jgi:omega-6 fatty acid desaturase (delta-12 desaturase)